MALQQQGGAWHDRPAPSFPPHLQDRRARERKPRLWLILVIVALAAVVGGYLYDRAGNWERHHEKAQELLEEARYDEAGDEAERALARAESRFGENDSRVALCLYTLGRIRIEQGLYPEAERYLKRSLTIYESPAAHDRQSVCTLLSDLGQLYFDRGEYDRAEPLYARALTIARQECGPGDVQLATACRGMGNLHRVLGRYDQAELLLTEAMAINRNARGAGHLSTGVTLNDLGVLYAAQGRYDEAEKVLAQALEISEGNLGPNHPEVTTNLSNLTDVYLAQQRYDEAEAAGRRALSIIEERFGLDHMAVTSPLISLGNLRSAQGRFDEAEALYTRALAIHKRVLGSTHATVAWDLQHLAWLCQQQSKYEEAEARYKQSVAMLEALGPPQRSGLATALLDFGAMYVSMYRNEQAIPLLERALTIREETLDDEHLDTAVVHFWLGCAYKFSKQHAKAREQLERALPVYLQAEGSDGETVAYIRANLGGPCLELDDLDAAEAYYTQALKVLEPAVADDPIIIMRCYYGLSAIAWKRGDFDTAHARAQRRTEIALQHLPEDRPWRAGTFLVVGEVYVAEGKIPKAEAEFRKAIEGYERIFGPDDPAIAQVLDEMKRIYEEAGHPDKAHECAERAAAIRAKAQEESSGEEGTAGDEDTPVENETDDDTDSSED